MIARHGTALVALLMALWALTACGEDSGNASPPSGWTTVQAGGLTLAYPPSLSPRPTSQRIKPKASIELTGPQRGQGSPPSLFVFVNRGPMGSLAFRERMLTDVLKAQLPAASFQSKRNIDVPGALAGRMLEFTWRSTGPGGATVPARQVEILIQTRDGPQYAIRYGAPKAQYDPQMVRQLVDTLRVRQQ